MNIITKSKYLIGLQCPKYLWIAVHNKDKIPEPDRAAQYIFDQGTKVGELATKIFPLGIDLANQEFKDNITNTKTALKERKPIFEAGFLEDNLFSRADILNPINEDEWEIIEVKSSTKVKDINIQDVAFQKHVYKKANLKITKCSLMHLNSEYIKKGELDINKLFTIDDITQEVNKINNIKENIEQMNKVLSDKQPDITIHKDCNKPYPCPLECSNLPEHNIFNLYRIGKRGFELFEQGIHHLKDVPSNFKLNDKQNIQVKCAKENKIHIHKEGIKHFLNTLHYPLYYLDFETFSTAVPMFDNTKPYSQVCFQFSLHVVDKVGDKPKHYEFLYDGSDDPRLDFLENLQKVLGSQGSIVVYNQSFEISRLKEMAVAYPEYEPWVYAVLDRVVDLLVPFRNFSYYNPLQHGSASIKKVLPAVTGESYDGLEIGNGGDASLSFYESVYLGVGDKEKVRENLLKYCCLDTEGMVWIVDGLKKVVG